ncbi:Copia protein [Bienertia sinuspersici]
MHNQWIIDSGATDHICYDLSLFHDYKAFQDVHNSITIAGGHKVLIEHVGTVKFSNGIILNKVLHVPGFKYNLLSTHKLCQDLGRRIVFTHDKCLVQGLSQRSPMVLGELCSGLYTAENAQVIPSVSHLIHIPHNSNGAFLSVSEDSKLWHLRLGHIPFNKLLHIRPKIKTSVTCDEFCTVCPKVRQTRLSFPKSHSKTTVSFALLHIDNWGPYKAKTSYGCNCFLTIVDDFSRHTWVFFLKHKSDAIMILQHFYAYIKVQFEA